MSIKITRKGTSERVYIELADIKDDDLGNYTLTFRPAFLRKPESFLLNLAFFALAWYMREFMEIENDIEYYVALYMPYLATILLVVNILKNLYNKFTTIFVVDSHQLIERNGIFIRRAVKMAPSEVSVNNVSSSFVQTIIGMGSVEIYGDNNANSAFTVSGIWHPREISDYIQRITFRASSGK